MAAIDGIELLATTDTAEALVGELVAQKAVLAFHPRDALHIAVVAVNGVRYLATWNFKHIANPTLQGRIAAVCRRAGFEPPVICTPEQLLEARDDPDPD